MFFLAIIFTFVWIWSHLEQRNVQHIHNENIADLELQIIKQKKIQKQLNNSTPNFLEDITYKVSILKEQARLLTVISNQNLN